jgi:hypothetical protein
MFHLGHFVVHSLINQDHPTPTVKVLGRLVVETLLPSPVEVFLLVYLSIQQALFIKLNKKLQKNTFE